MFRHPNYYKELRKLRNKLDQAISSKNRDGECERAPGSGLMKSQATSKSQAASVKRQAFEPTCSTNKRQASQP